MFMLESHLNVAQLKAVAEMQAAAAEAKLSLYLTGGTVRDMIGGFPVRELEFTVEGPAVQFARKLVQAGGTLLRVDDLRKTAVLEFQSGAKGTIGMSRLEHYPKPGAKPQVTPATIHEHLRQRDFTVNALALSLNKASRGLLIDPTNGLSDLEQKEVRAVSNYGFYDAPIRTLRLLRLKSRLGFTVAERTQSQYENALESGVLKQISIADLLTEVLLLAREQNIGEVLEAWDAAGMLRLISPALSASAVSANFAKLQKAWQLLPFGADLVVDEVSLFFTLLTEKMATKDKTALAAKLGLDPAVAENWLKLDARAAKLEKELAASTLNKASLIYQALSKAKGEQIFLLLVRSTQRTVQERIRAYFGKHLPSALEVTEAQLHEMNIIAGAPKYEKLKAEVIRKKLDARPKKIIPPPEPEPVPEPPPVPIRGGGRSNFTAVSRTS